MDTLSDRLKKIERVFDLDEILKLNPDKDYIRKYYKKNQLAYSLFHTFSDRMYMGISRDGVYKNEDLLEAARFVEKYINNPQGGAKRVLELATGRGSTSYYLAAKYPKVLFKGIDISEGQLYFAYKKANKVKNYKPEKGDYHDLKKFKNGIFDILFVIEALCYSVQKEKVLSEAYRVLRKGGVFIIFDGYLGKENISKKELLLKRLIEKGMAVPNFDTYRTFINKARKSGFSIEYEEDVSKLIMPTLRKFEKLAHHYFCYSLPAKIIAKIFPKEFLFNAVSGYLFPEAIKRGLGSYYITILRKPEADSV